MQARLATLDRLLVVQLPRVQEVWRERVAGVKFYWKWWKKRHPLTQSMIIIGFYLVCLYIIGIS